ncbi:MAG: protein-export chaperone SecB [Gammaproteobacteria bacterium]|nr:protein-export chaperone SecB [Gammaproteobacteria bacterium]MDP2139939.1 protein-export chaperone SecB [Gammaproteobacteria bacterium]MDP2347759.1 protein-export chaperone SecB [Gammaproteobacteria bacterium]
MAENTPDQNNTSAPTAPEAGAANGQEAKAAGPAFALQRIYLKDASFESPRSPLVFQGQWTPKITFNLGSKSTRVAEGVFEVVLTITVEAKLEDNPAFLAEVHQAGIFTCAGLTDSDLEHVLAAVCPNILFPYAREAIDGLVVKGSFPPINLAPVNFDALYVQSKQRQAAELAPAVEGGAAN